MQPPTDSFSTLDSNRKELPDLAEPRFGTSRVSETGSTRSHVKLRAEVGTLVQAQRCEPQDLVRKLNKTRLILDAKRSQLKKMQQLSRLRFINKLISRAYLDEVASDIAWYEAIFEKTTRELRGPNETDRQSLNTASPFPPVTTGTRN